MAGHDGRQEFFDVTKAFTTACRATPVELTDERARSTKTSTSERRAAPRHYDFIVVHDPQPAHARWHADEGAGTRWIWRCHIDTSTPDPALYDFLVPFIRGYDAAIYTMAVRARRATVPLAIVPPAIDPLAPKNMALVPEDAPTSCGSSASTPTGRCCCRSRASTPGRTRSGVVDAYRRSSSAIPVQLALIGSMASDDPEGWDYLEKLHDYAGGDPDVYVLSNLDNMGSVEVNAFQSHAEVVLQKSTREGFGLTVSEGLWKARPVVAGAVGGSRCRSRTA